MHHKETVGPYWSAQSSVHLVVITVTQYDNLLKQCFKERSNECRRKQNFFNWHILVKANGELTTEIW